MQISFKLEENYTAYCYCYFFEFWQELLLGWEAELQIYILEINSKK